MTDHFHGAITELGITVTVSVTRKHGPCSGLGIHGIGLAMSAPELPVDPADLNNPQTLRSQLGKICRGFAQKLVGVPRSADFTLQCLELLGDLRRPATAFAAVDLALLHPFQQRVPSTPDLLRHRCDRGSAGGIIVFVAYGNPRVVHHPIFSEFCTVTS